MKSSKNKNFADSSRVDPRRLWDWIAMSGVPKQTGEGQYLVMEADLGGAKLENIGILLLDAGSNQLHFRFRRDLKEFAGNEADWFEQLPDDVRSKSLELGADQYLKWLELTLSNTLRISTRKSVLVDDLDRTMNRLYAMHVLAQVLPYRTHLPQFMLRAAAGGFGEQMEVEPPECWVEVPPQVALAEGMFVIHVVGHSMEPVIPDNSLCVFQQIMDGVYSEKPVLLQLYGEPGGSRYTVKMYHRAEDQGDRQEGDGWLHERMTLESLNPSYPPWDLMSDSPTRIVGELVFVL
jgi:SOS-response transcriptional repressor LexA